MGVYKLFPGACLRTHTQMHLHVYLDLTVAASTCHPGVFGTVEMKPSTVGTWLVECNIGDYQLAGMRARLLVFDPRRCTNMPTAVESTTPSSQRVST